MKTLADSLRSNYPRPTPPMSQSRRGDTACENLYVHKHVRCARVAGSEPAARGECTSSLASPFISSMDLAGARIRSRGRKLQRQIWKMATGRKKVEVDYFRSTDRVCGGLGTLAIIADGECLRNSQESNLGELPSDLRAIIDELDKSDREARRTITGLSNAQANWRPRETAWSVAQCVDHLARTNTMYAAALLVAVKDARAVTEPRRAAIQPAWFGRFFIRTLEPPPKTKLRAPKKIIPHRGQAGRKLCRHFFSRKSRCERSFENAPVLT